MTVELIRAAITAIATAITEEGTDDRFGIGGLLLAPLNELCRIDNAIRDGQL